MVAASENNIVANLKIRIFKVIHCVTSLIGTIRVM